MTNITPEQCSAFDALVSGDYANFALFSCFVNGEPAAAIVAVDNKDDGGVILNPLFVTITPSLKLTDHEGRTPGEVTP